MDWGQVKVWAKEHPYLVGALFIGLLLLVYLYFSSSSSAAPAGNSNAAANEQAKIAAEAQLGTAQIAANAATAQSGQQASAAKFLAHQQALSTILPAILAEKAANKQTAAQVSIAATQARSANLMTTTLGYSQYAKLLGQYGPRGAAMLTTYLPPPPGANPQSYPSTGGALTPSQFASVSNLIGSNLATQYYGGSVG